MKKTRFGTLSLLMVLVALCIGGCKDEKAWIEQQSKDEQEFGIRLVRGNFTLEEMLAFVDSLEHATTLSKAEIELMRAHVYLYKDPDEQSSNDHYRKAYELYTQESDPKPVLYAEATFRYANVLQGAGNIEKAIEITMATLKRYEGDDRLTDQWRSNLLNMLGVYQIKLGQNEEGKETFEKVYQTKLKIAQQKLAPANDLFIMCVLSAEQGVHMHDNDYINLWLERAGKALDDFAQDIDSVQLKRNREYLAFRKMTQLIKAGKKEEAYKLYDKTPIDALLNYRPYSEAVPIFLSIAERYAEAADMYQRIDSMYGKDVEEKEPTFDSFSGYYKTRYDVNRLAGRDKVALVFADSVFNNMDSALVRLRRDNAVELSTIYKTHEKELELKDAQAEARIHRILLIASAIIIVLIGYLFVRTHQTNKELMAKNRRLLDEIEQREQEELLAIQHLKAESEEELTADQQIFRRLCELLDNDEHYYTDPDLDRNALAKQIGTNEHYLSNAVGNCTDGKSLADFLNGYRLRYATRLLATTNEPISLIAEVSGFSRSSFYRLFNDAYSMSPADYRAVAKKK